MITDRVLLLEMKHAEIMSAFADRLLKLGGAVSEAPKKKGDAFNWPVRNPPARGSLRRPLHERDVWQPLLCATENPPGPGLGAGVDSRGMDTSGRMTHDRL